MNMGNDLKESTGAPLGVLKKVFGYDGFRLNQKDIVDAVVSGENVFVLMPTGGGKSLCYQVPGLIREGVAVVVSPLVAVMKDQVDALRGRGLRAEYISSSQSAATHRDTLSGIRAGEVDFFTWRQRGSNYLAFKSSFEA
ncbi:hypothetical protein AYJ57_21590 (plasmid) [Salipiger sp. CCB-MM3]|uniref:DEAD/DEAH box helicase n=1 Tax=Salipiger sp. CCB-MM3 TaxID=1792508 RepID=UPI00080A974F|nr:DEAD/DEAH box helicase [Salipiger sp. CCB-MM3]ANT63067.1 hypothetical protein AYJ57_21590 [Salipiger sp. CCB-MM3]